DRWRRLPEDKTAEAPASWRTARDFWKEKAAALDSWGEKLAAHLAVTRHPYDRLSARVVLRSLSPAREAVVAPATAALDEREDIPAFRVARFELERSARSAYSALRSAVPSQADLKRRRFPRAEIDGLLADLARIGARTKNASLTDQAIAQLA